MEAERAALCGPRCAHLTERQAQRSGHVPSSLGMGGRGVKVERPRARSVDGHELSLPSWQAWSARDPLDERAFMNARGPARAVCNMPPRRTPEDKQTEGRPHGVAKKKAARRKTHTAT